MSLMDNYQGECEETKSALYSLKELRNEPSKLLTILNEKLARFILIGNPEEIQRKVDEFGLTKS
jgi:phosphotransacetylase